MLHSNSRGDPILGVDLLLNCTFGGKNEVYLISRERVNTAILTKHHTKLELHEAHVPRANISASVK